jgi:hypothetical protein
MKMNLRRSVFHHTLVFTSGIYAVSSNKQTSITITSPLMIGECSFETKAKRRRISAYRGLLDLHALQGPLYLAAIYVEHLFPSKKPVKSSETFHQQHLPCSVVGRFVDGNSKVGLPFEQICSWRFKTQMQPFMLTFTPGLGHTNAALLGNGQRGHRLELRVKR